MVMNKTIATERAPDTEKLVAVERRSAVAVDMRRAMGSALAMDRSEATNKSRRNIQAEDPIGSPGQQAADRMWEVNAKQNRARACRLAPECEDPYACWCEGMQEIEDSNLW
jgi:hypothetical protein